MPRVVKRLTPKEILNILNKQYLNVVDIKKIASVNIENARKIREEITGNLKADNYFVPDKLIPSESLIKYLNLNLNYLKKLSNCCDSLDDLKIVKQKG